MAELSFADFEFSFWYIFFTTRKSDPPGVCCVQFCLFHGSFLACISTRFVFNPYLQQKSSAFLVSRNVKEASNSVVPDQTAPIVCSGSTLFASILNSSVM